MSARRCAGAAPGQTPPHRTPPRRTPGVEGQGYPTPGAAALGSAPASTLAIVARKPSSSAMT